MIAADASIIIRAGAPTLIVQQGSTQLALLQTGPAGKDATGFYTKISDSVISGHKVVKAVSDTHIAYPDLLSNADANLILGVTANSAQVGDNVQVQSAGEMVEPSWNWQAGPVFCGQNGELTQTLAFGAAWLRQVAVAVAPDRLLIQLRPPTLL